jgi:hypothetical protein
MYKLTDSDQRRIDRGYSIPLNTYDEKGDMIYRHFPLYERVDPSHYMDCSFRFFHDVWKGEA